MSHCHKRYRSEEISPVKKTIAYLFPKVNLSKYIKKIRDGVLGKQETESDISLWNMLHPDDQIKESVYDYDKNK